MWLLHPYINLWVHPRCVLTANFLVANSILITELVLSSVFAFVELCSVKSCASVFPFNQPLNFKLWEANLYIRGPLFRLESLEGNLKTQTRQEILAEQLMMLPLLCIYSCRKQLLSVSKWALTTAFGLPKYLFQGLKCIFLHEITVCKLSNGSFCSPCDKSFDMRHVDLIRQRLRSNGLSLSCYCFHSGRGSLFLLVIATL